MKKIPQKNFQHNSSINTLMAFFSHTQQQCSQNGKKSLKILMNFPKVALNPISFLQKLKFVSWFVQLFSQFLNTVQHLYVWKDGRDLPWLTIKKSSLCIEY